MSTAFRPNPQGSPLALNVTGGRAAVPELGLNARRVISKRYSLKDAQGNPIEEWSDVVRRVVGHVSLAETDERKRDEFYSTMSGIMLRREFVPNTPCLVNAGKPSGQLAACFVLDVPDSIAGIMKTATDAAIIHQTGGGTSLGTIRLDHGAHLRLPFSRSWGARGVSICCQKKAGAHVAPSSARELLRVLRLACSRERESPVPRGAEAGAQASRLNLVPSGAQYTYVLGGCQ